MQSRGALNLLDGLFKWRAGIVHTNRSVFVMQQGRSLCVFSLLTSKTRFGWLACTNVCAAHVFAALSDRQLYKPPAFPQREVPRRPEMAQWLLM